MYDYSHSVACLFISQPNTVNRSWFIFPLKLTPFMPPKSSAGNFSLLNAVSLKQMCNRIMEKLWKRFPEFAHCIKPPFKVLSIPAAEYWSPESSWRPKALQRIDRLCRFTLRCLDELSMPWYKTMTKISSIYVTWVVVNFKIGFWAATGKLQTHCNLGEMTAKEHSIYSPSESIRA